MNATIDRIKLIFLGLFVFACVAMWAYDAFYVWPKQRCEANGDWWDEKDRVCAVPMPIWAFTHRIPGEVAPTTPHAASPKAGGRQAGPASEVGRRRGQALKPAAAAR